MVVSCNASGHNYSSSSVIVDLAMGQIPHSTERISSYISVVVQRFMKVSGGAVHEKWAKLLDKLTIAGHCHQTAAEVYAEITDHMPLLYEVSYHLSCLMYSVPVCCSCCNDCYRCTGDTNV